MKKVFALLAFAAAITVVLSSCKPDDELYKTKCQIYKIWNYSNVGDPDEVWQYSDKGNLLETITIDSVEVYNFNYNKDKTVASILHVGKDYTETIEMTYTDRLVDKMVYKVNDTVRQEITFTRDEETTRIVKIEELFDKSFYEQYNIFKKSGFYAKFVGDPMRICNMIRENGAKDLVLHCTKKIVYDPGEKEKYENIAMIVEDYPDLRQTITRTYTYDPESYNPYYGLSFAYAGYKGYYVNNKLTETEELRTSSQVSRVIYYSYDYSGMNYLNAKAFPRQFITRSSAENNIPRNTYILYRIK